MIDIQFESMKKSLFLICAFLSLITCIAQDTGDTLYLDSNKFLTRYLHNDNRVRTAQLAIVTENVPSAHQKMKKAVVFKRISNGIKHTSAAALISPVVAYFFLEGETLVDIVGFRPIFLAAGLFVVSIPSNSIFKKNAREGAAFYNKEVRSRRKSSASMKLDLTPNGLGFTCVF
jgi:hypothetical protein